MLTLVVFVFVAFANLILLSKLLEHRTDLKPGDNPFGGPSASWQGNVFGRATYDETGRRLRRWCVAGIVAQVVVGALLGSRWLGRS